MDWERKENYSDFIECWLVGERYFEERESVFVWNFTAEVFINKRKNSTTVEFVVLDLPRHWLEDLAWKTLDDGILDLTAILTVMNELRNLSNGKGIKVFSDDFQNFRACFEVKSTDKELIEEKILQARRALSLNISCDII